MSGIQKLFGYVGSGGGNGTGYDSGRKHGLEGSHADQKARRLGRLSMPHSMMGLALPVVAAAVVVMFSFLRMK